MVDIDCDKVVCFGFNVGDIQDIVVIVFGGCNVGILFEGDCCFDIVICLLEILCVDLLVLFNLLILLLLNNLVWIDFILLLDVVCFDFLLGLNQISWENGKWCIVVSVNVCGCDIGLFVLEV